LEIAVKNRFVIKIKLNMNKILYLLCLYITLYINLYDLAPAPCLAQAQQQASTSTAKAQKKKATLDKMKKKVAGNSTKEAKEKINKSSIKRPKWMDEKLYCDACVGVVSNGVTLHDQMVSEAEAVSGMKSRNETEKKKELTGHAKKVLAKLCESETLSKYTSIFSDAEKKTSCRSLVHSWSSKLGSLLINRKSSDIGNLTK